MATTIGWMQRTPSDQFTSSMSADDVIEMPLLLPEWQVVALEEAARDRGMTIGQLVRRLFADLFPRPTADR